MQKYYWMAVTPDEYELPLLVAQSATALAMKLGVHRGTIFACEARKRSGRYSGRKIVKVKVKE